ncbi:MAG: LLM class F420-dependent oxidoreductase [Proteobacteria bacterium]|nr:LLM class F420-dependent oxidoreductase [Pseudomonadota bacterium]
MRLGLLYGYSGAKISIDMELIREAERLGYDSVWTAEAWGSDAVAPLCWMGAQTETIKLGTAIMQLPGRSPANTAMTAMTIDQLSGGRFLLGLGTSGPQVVEGWHGQPWHKPLAWMREYITIVKKILARAEPLRFDGERYQIPYRGADSAGLGKPLKSILHSRADIPIYTGSLAPKGLALCGELCDGVLLTCMNPERPEAIVQHLETGLARAGGGKSLTDFDIAVNVAVRPGDDLDACRLPLKAHLALYMGGMGAQQKNFHNEYIGRLGFEAAAAEVQDLYLAGKKKAAIAAVPDELVDTLYLCGPRERIRDRLQVWTESPVTTMLVGSDNIEAIRMIAELVL